MLISEKIGLMMMIIIPIVLIVIMISLTIKTFKGYEKRANEKLMLERESTLTLQKRVDEQNERLVIIEKMLKEVE